MFLATKQYRVSAYLISFDKKIDAPSENIFLDIEKAPIKYKGDNNKTYFLEVKTEGNAAKGVLSCYTIDRIKPMVGKPGEPSRIIDLNKDEGLIDRSHFLYFFIGKRHAIIWQENNKCGKITKLDECLKSRGIQVICNPMLTTEEFKNLLLERHKPRSLECEIAIPNDSAIYDPKDFEILNMLNNTGGKRVSFRFYADAYRKKGCFQNISAVWNTVKRLKNIQGTQKLNVILENIDHPVDLFGMDRIQGKIKIKIPSSNIINEHDVYSELENFKNKVKEQLDIYLKILT